MLLFDYDFLAIIHVDAALCGLSAETATVEGEPSICLALETCVIHGQDPRCLGAVAEVQQDAEGVGVGGQIASEKAVVQTEHCATGAYGHSLGGIVERVVSTEIEHALVTGCEGEGRERTGEIYIIRLNGAQRVVDDIRLRFVVDDIIFFIRVPADEVGFACLYLNGIVNTTIYFTDCLFFLQS